MADARQLLQDLSFVREAVTRRERTPNTSVAITWVWAVYVLVGYTLIDVAPDGPAGFSCSAGSAAGC